MKDTEKRKCADENVVNHSQNLEMTKNVATDTVGDGQKITKKKTYADIVNG